MARRAASALALVLGASAKYQFISFGDWGTGSALQAENARAINAFCAGGGPGSPCELIATLGDSFYNGPNTTWDERWTKRWLDMYNVSSPWQSVMGNHDYSGTLSAYVDFQRNDTRWRMPSTNYTLVVPEADMTIVFVDTPRACPSYMSAPYGDCTEQCMLQLAELGCTNSTSVACWAEHVAWLNASLAAATTRWKLVAGHHPIDQEHMPALAPALAAHGVQALLAGHVHNMQHATGADGVQYFISGAGAFASLDHAAAPVAPGAAAGGGGGGAAGSDDLPGDVRVGTTHRPRPVACAAGSVCAPSTARFLADGPGFLALSVDNDAMPPTTTARFMHANGSVLYTFAFSA